MALSPDEFHRHALTAADDEGRLPLARMTEWDISPFEQDGLRVAPLRAPSPLDRTRDDADGPSTCRSCARRDEGVWIDDRWRLTRVSGAGVPLELILHPRDHHDLGDLPDDLAAELGVLTAHLVRHVEGLANVARAHVNRWGDGGAHLHVWFVACPANQPQLLGSWLIVWDDLLPAYPDDVAAADAEHVVEALIDSYGGRRP